MKHAILLFLALATLPALAQKHGPGNGPGHSPLYPHRPYLSTVHSSPGGGSGWLGNGPHNGGIYREGHLLSTKHGHH